MKPGIALIGPGKVGCAISRRLYQQDYPLLTVRSRDQKRAEEACQFIGCGAACAATDLPAAAAAEILLLAVPDDQIAAAAAQLHPLLPPRRTTTLIHFSGLHPAAVLGENGTPVRRLSLHPLLPFASRELAVEKLTGCPCALEGDESALPLGEELVRAFGGIPFRIPSTQKALYHAAACIASNYLVTLLASAGELLSRCGIERGDTLPLLLPLLQATLDNCTRLGPKQGLTGPIVRGDCGTVATHLSSLQQSAPDYLELYLLLGEKTLELAGQGRRLTADKDTQLLELFNKFTAHHSDHKE